MTLDLFQTQLITTGIFLIILYIIRTMIQALITKISVRNGMNLPRIQLMNRYVTVVFVIFALITIPYIFGTPFSNLVVLFSSVFAVIGIGLFAIWSILSNITSGVIIFFSFPYKVGDKIQIHDKDFPLEGIIEDIRAFQLHLRIDNGDLVTYPNNLILQRAVTLIQKDALDHQDDGTDLI